MFQYFTLPELLNDKECLKNTINLSLKADDPDTKVGALLVRKSTIVNNEYIYLYVTNDILYPLSRGIPPNIYESTNIRQRIKTDKEYKRTVVEHAERNLIYSAAHNHVYTYGATVYCTWFACNECAKGLIQSGIKRVVGLNLSNVYKSNTWDESIKVGLKNLKDCGVEIKYLPLKEFKGMQLFMGGKVINL